ncbi:MAG: hypothetical protein R2713_11135 [Ilumatobacteraceae bacterium]
MRAALGADGTPDAEAEAGRVRWALDDGHRRGAIVAAAVGDASADGAGRQRAIARWTATCLDDPLRAPRPWWRHVQRADAEPDATLTTGCPLVDRRRIGRVVVDASRRHCTPRAVGAARRGAIVTAILTTRGTPHGWVKLAVQGVVGAFTMAGMGAIAVSATRRRRPACAVSGPLPHVLMLLVVLHGLSASTGVPDARRCRSVRWSRCTRPVSGSTRRYPCGSSCAWIAALRRRRIGVGARSSGAATTSRRCAGDDPAGCTCGRRPRRRRDGDRGSAVGRPDPGRSGATRAAVGADHGAIRRQPGSDRRRQR